VMKHGNQKLRLDDCLANLLTVEDELERDVEQEGSAFALTARLNKTKLQRKGAWNKSTKGTTCFYCGEKGHIRINCLKRRDDIKAIDQERRLDVVGSADDWEPRGRISKPNPTSLLAICEGKSTRRT
jgi:hypothetical protein